MCPSRPLPAWTHPHHLLVLPVESLPALLATQLQRLSLVHLSPAHLLSPSKGVPTALPRRARDLHLHFDQPPQLVQRVSAHWNSVLKRKSSLLNCFQPRRKHMPGCVPLPHKASPGLCTASLCTYPSLAGLAAPNTQALKSAGQSPAGVRFGPAHACDILASTPGDCEQLPTLALTQEPGTVLGILTSEPTHKNKTSNQAVTLLGVTESGQAAQARAPGGITCTMRPAIVC
jgi:hypothetical protein